MFSFLLLPNEMIRIVVIIVLIPNAHECDHLTGSLTVLGKLVG